MIGHEDHTGLDEEDHVDDDMMAKQSAMKSLSKHIGADSGSDDEQDSGEEPSDMSDHYDPSEGAVPLMTFHKKKKSGGGGGMGGMMGGMGGGGGMDMSSIAGMFA